MGWALSQDWAAVAKGCIAYPMFGMVAVFLTPSTSTSLATLWEILPLGGTAGSSVEITLGPVTMDGWRGRRTVRLGGLLQMPSQRTRRRLTSAEYDCRPYRPPLLGDPLTGLKMK